jgi:prepilin-type N-terminal cleavage/methylation domain-containing protein
MIGNKRTAPGFTLIEMLITITIFSLVSVVLAQSFVSFNRLHRKVANQAVLGQDARFINEMLVRAARNFLVDYSDGTYEPVTHTLALTSSDGMTRILVAVKTPADGLCDNPRVSCLMVSVNHSEWYQITSKQVTVDQFDVVVRPGDDPFGTLAPSNIQPFISTTMKLRYVSDRAQDDVSLQTQTAVSSRVYRR